jgi:hypothetical protein
VTGPLASTTLPPSQTCKTTPDRGTSFATPLLAGSALLAREYFVSGYYPTGARVPSHGFNPSGALIKAILLHGTSSLDSIQYDDGTTAATSLGDNNQGYGRVQLDQALSFGVNCTLEGLTFFVKGAADPASEHYAEISDPSDPPQVFTFRTLDEDHLDPIRVTLVYTVSLPQPRLFLGIFCTFPSYPVNILLSYCPSCV